MKIFDYIIIGGGPTGIVASYFLAQQNHKILLLEHSSHLGGCWYTDMTNGYMIEHSPKVIGTSSHPHFIQFIKQLDVPFDTYNVYSNIMLKLVKFFISNTTIHDLTRLIKICSLRYYKFPFQYHQSVTDWMKNNSISPMGTRMITKLCIALANIPDKLAIGVLIDSLISNPITEFVQLKRPNEWIERATDELVRMNVDIRFNTTVHSVDDINMSVSCKSNTYYGGKIIFTVPVKELYTICKYSSLNMRHNWFANMNVFKQFVDQSTYFGIGIQLHFEEKISTDNKDWCWSCMNDWSIIVTDRTPVLNSSTIRTVWSCAIVDVESTSKRLGKTANQCTMNEIKEEVVHQLSITHGSALNPVKITSHNDLYRENNAWNSIRSSYSNSIGTVPMEGKFVSNVYTLGPHTQREIATIDSGIKSAIIFCKPNYLFKKMVMFTSITFLMYCVVNVYVNMPLS